MAYLVEWYGKGLGLKFYGDSVLPPTMPPPWRGNKAHMVCGGFRKAWPVNDIDRSPLDLSDFDPGILGCKCKNNLDFGLCIMYYVLVALI
jgi:hypothetical protein